MSFPNIIQIPEFLFHGVPLTEENSKRLIQLLLLTQNQPETLLSEDSEIGRSFLAQILLKRIEGYKLPYTITLFFFLMSLLTFVDRPGHVMILLWLCHQYYKRTGTLQLGINDWVKIFPFGIPSESELNTWWESQKIPKEKRTNITDNLVDIAELWR